MKVKLDENVPRSAALALIDAGHDVDTVTEEGLTGAADDVVLAAATDHGRLLVTLDRGLADIRRHPPGAHAGVLVLRVNDQSATAVRDLVTTLLALHDLDSLRCRLRRPA